MKALIDRKMEEMDAFVKIFGNEENMEKKYPKTYEAYKETCAIREKMLAGKPVEELFSEEQPEEFEIEVSHISYTDETKQYVQVDLRAVAADPKGYCILTAFSPQIATGENLLDKEVVMGDVCSDFTGDQEEVCLQIPAKYFDEGQNEALEIVVRLYTVDDNVTPYECREILSLYGLNYSGTFTIDAPIRTHKNKENTDINIAYRYKGGVFTEDLRDYFYSSAELSDGCLRIPSKGKVKVQGVNLHNISSVMLTAVNAKGQGFCHNDAAAVLEDAGTISWNMPDSFGNPYEKILDSLYCYVTYKLEIKAVSQGKPYTFLVTNDQNAKPALNKKIIERINIYKDCFEAGVKIRLQDGSEKQVEDICAGDMLSTPEGGIKVKDIQRVSMITAMVHMKGENGKEVSVSINHPFETDKGLVCANLLEAGTEVYTLEGKTKIAELCVTPGVETVLYHVTLESCNRLYVNGFLAGDSAAELSAAELANNLRYQVPEEWREDYDSWEKRNGLLTQRMGL